MPIEIKSAETFHRQFAATVDKFRGWVGGRAPTGWVVYGGDVDQTIGDNRLVSFRRCATIVVDEQEPSEDG